MLSFLCTAQFWGEAAKLLAQLGGALFIARLTVQWALGRYKTEKAWDREYAAMFDVLGAIADMKEVNAEWFDDFLASHDPEDQPAIDKEREAEQDALRLAKWREAKRKLDAVSATSSIVLSKPAEEALSQLNDALNAPREDDYFADLQATDEALRTARAELIRLGRQRFGVNNVRP